MKLTKEKENVSKKNKKKKSKRIFKRPVQSTQQNIPIRDIYRGIVITKDRRYIKIMEVKPITYELKSPSDQMNIFSSFQQLLKVAPSSLQLTEMSFPANLEKPIAILDEDIENEANPNCLNIDKAYRKKLVETQYNTVTRRFFISFQYEGKVGFSFSRNNLERIAYELNRTASMIANILNQCGNEVVGLDDEYPTDQVQEILYTIFNRNEIIEKSYTQNFYEVYARYQKANVKYDVDFTIPKLEFFAPKSVSYMNSKYVVVNGNTKNPGTYYSFLYIPKNGYCSKVIPAWTNIFVNSYDGVDTNIFLERVPKTKVLTDIRRNITYSQVDAGTTSENSAAFDSASDTFISGNYLKDGLNEGQDFYYMSILITVTGKSPEEVNFKLNAIKEIALQHDIRMHDCAFFEEEAFISALPLCNPSKRIWAKSKRNVLTEGAAATYPFTAFELMDDNGIYFGDNIANNSLALIDIFNTDKFANPNIFICGQTGSGKTYSLLLMAIRMRIKHIPVYILAPEKEHEFRRVCEALGGQFIQMGAGSPNRINIMEIFKKDEDANKAIDGQYQQMSYLSEKVLALKNFFTLLIPDISVEEKQLLDEAIIKTYAKFGITSDNDSLIDPEDILHQRFKKMPIISDLREELASSERTTRMANIINVLCTGSGSNFNGQTNVDLNNDFTIIGLEHLSGDMMPLGIYMAMDFVWSKIKEDRTKRKALFIDEWWKLAYNPVAAEYSLEIAKIIRAYGGAMVLATQQMSDILAIENGKFGQAVLNNCKIKILLKMERDDAQSVQRILGLTDKEAERLKIAERGEALFVADQNNIAIKFISSEEEHMLITTDRKHLEELKNQKQNEPNDIEFMDSDDFEDSELFDFDSEFEIDDVTEIDDNSLEKEDYDEQPNDES